MSFLLVLVFFSSFTFHRSSAAFVVDFVCAKSRAEVCPSELLWNVLPHLHLYYIWWAFHRVLPFLVYFFTTSQVELRSFCVMLLLSLAKKKGAKGGSSRSATVHFYYIPKRSSRKTVSQTSRTRSCPPPNSWLMVWLGEGILGSSFCWRTMGTVPLPSQITISLMYIPAATHPFFNSTHPSLNLSLSLEGLHVFSSLLPIIGDDWIRSCGHLVVHI